MAAAVKKDPEFTIEDDDQQKPAAGGSDFSVGDDETAAPEAKPETFLDREAAGKNTTWDRIKHGLNPLSFLTDTSEGLGKIGDIAQKKSDAAHEADIQATGRGEKPRGTLGSIFNPSQGYDLAARTARMASGLTEPKNVAIGAGAIAAPEIVGPALVAHGLSTAAPIVSKYASNVSKEDLGGGLSPEEAEEGLGGLAEAAGGGAAIGEIGARGGLGKTATAKAGGAALDALGNPLGLGLEGHELLTKGVGPRARATGWQDAIQSPGVQRAILEQHAQTPITGLEDFKDAIPQMKEKLWDEKVQPALDRQGPRPVDMKPAAKAVRDAITPEMRQFDEAGVKTLESLADKLERSRTVAEASDLQKYANAQVESYFNKYPTARRSALAANPDTLGWETARRAIREQLNDTLEHAGETETAEARKDYGHMTTLEKELEKKVNVNDRKAPTGLYNFLGTAGGLASLLAGHGVMAAGLYGLGKVAEHFNKPDVMIRRGIENLKPPEAPAFTAPAPFVPPQYAEPANPARAALPAPAVPAGYDAGPSGPVRGGRWTTPAGLLPESVPPIGGPKGLLPGIGELVPRGTPLPEPGAAELAHPEMFPKEPIGAEAQPQTYRRPKGRPGAGQMARGYTGEAKPRVVGWTADGGPIYEKTPGQAAKPPETAPVGEGGGVKPMVPPAREVGIQPLGKGFELGKGEDLGEGLGTQHEITKNGERVGSITVEPRGDGVLHVHWLGGDLGADAIRGPLLDALKQEYPETTKLTYDRRRLAKGANAATTEPREMNLGEIGAEHAPTGSVWEGLSQDVKDAFDKEKLGPVKKTGMEDLQVGDTFVDHEGEPRRVMEITEDGKIHTADGTEVTYDGDIEHLGEINSPRAQLARGGKFIPKEKPTAKASEEVKKAIEGTDLEFRGRDEMGINHLHDPQTQTTLAVYDKDLDNAKIKERLEAKRDEFWKTPQEEETH